MYDHSFPLDKHPWNKASLDGGVSIFYESTTTKPLIQEGNTASDASCDFRL